MTRRRAMTLVEVMLAMFVATAVVAMLGTVVSRIVSANAAAREHLQTIVALGRLGEQFRRDVHAAHTATVLTSETGAAQLKLEIDPHRTIEYEITPAGLTRHVGTAKKTHERELFLLPGMRFLGWSVDEDGRQVSLSIGRLNRPDSDAAIVAGRFSLVAAMAAVEPASAPSQPNPN